MTAEKPANLIRCHECGAHVMLPAEQCWMCKAPIDDSSRRDTAAVTAENPYAPPAMPAPRTFQLSSLMLTIALISVLLGVTRLAPGLGVGLFILVVPAYARTISIAGRRKVEEKRLSVGEKFSAFIESLAVVVMILVASGAAFYATCWIPTGIGLATSDNLEGLGTGMLVGVILGIGVGIWVAIWVGRKLWPRRS